MVVVANPPYSARWDNSDRKLKDPRFKDYGLAPKTKADYAFLLHGLYHLDQNGTMAIVLPHGVLFRGAKKIKFVKLYLKRIKLMPLSVCLLAYSTQLEFRLLY